MKYTLRGKFDGPTQIRGKASLGGRGVGANLEPFLGERVTSSRLPGQGWGPGQRSWVLGLGLLLSKPKEGKRGGKEVERGGRRGGGGEGGALRSKMEDLGGGLRHWKGSTIGAWLGSMHHPFLWLPPQISYEIPSF
jgi:hypothetical protein